MADYDVGDQVRCSVVFKNLAGAVADPTAVVFKYKTPDNTETTYTYGIDSQLVKDSVGNYHVDIILTAARNWWVRFNGTGALTASDEKQVVVEKSQFVTPL